MAHLPRQAVGLAALVSKVAHFAVLYVHSRLSHMFFGSSSTCLGVVGDDLRDGADVRSTIFLVFVWGIGDRVPGENLA